MIKGAIFDVDGTLMDSMWVWRESFNRFVAAHGVTPYFDAEKEFFTRSLTEGAALIRKELGLQESPQEIINELASVSRELYLAEVELKPNVPEFLESLAHADIPMTIVTSGEQSIVESVFEKFGIGSYFKRIYAATNEGIPKRFPDLWERARHLMGSTPEETWVFEDAHYAISVTNQLGYRSVGIADADSAAAQDDVRTIAHLYWEEYPTAIPPELMAA